MNWDDEGGRPSAERSAPRDPWREPRGDFRPGRKGLEDRLESWVSRGRDLVDGVSGTRPGTRSPARGSERSGPGGRPGLDGLGRWVEGRLDWLLDDRDDWREPWQEAETMPTDRWEAAVPQARSARPPLQAISRRGAPSSAPGPRSNRSSASSVSPPQAMGPAEERAEETALSQEWPEEETFSVPRWRRAEPTPQRAANPLADPAPAPPPGRPLPRSTRRR